MRTRRQRLGQHFLRDAGVARAIAGALAETPAAVIEIGPGRGALTRPLRDRFPRVRAVELDPTLAAALERRLGTAGNLEVRRGDALTVDLDDVGAGGPWQVAANLPYGVATPILRRFLTRPDLFVNLVIMVQREVALRLAAREGGRERGLLTLEVEARANAELLFDVPPRCFSPPPRVTSSVVRLRPGAPPAEPEVVARALELASAAFAHRRKKLANALAGVAPPEEVSAALAAAGADGARRPQEIGLDRWLALAAALPQAGPARRGR